jgi:hypothetical protein
MLMMEQETEVVTASATGVVVRTAWQRRRRCPLPWRSGLSHDACDHYYADQFR